MKKETSLIMIWLVLILIFVARLIPKIEFTNVIEQNIVATSTKTIVEKNYDHNTFYVPYILTAKEAKKVPECGLDTEDDEFCFMRRDNKW